MITNQQKRKSISSFNKDVFWGLRFFCRLRNNLRNNSGSVNKTGEYFKQIFFYHADASIKN